jgi:predicted peptidase
MMELGKALILGLLFVPMGLGCLEGQDMVDGFHARTFKGPNGVNMPYRLFIPGQEAQGDTPPLIIYLHGAGGAGTDNLRQISGGNTNGTHFWTTPEMQNRFPAFVLAPQLPATDRWSAFDSDDLAPYAQLVVELLPGLMEEFSVDPDRVYLIGQSRGGSGTWDMASKRRALFAAAVPLCGMGNPSRASSMQDLPVWAFHGALDEVVPVSESREMVAALKAVGSPVKYAEFPEVGHDVWNHAFKEPGLGDWLFSQKRTVRQDPG